MLQPVFPLPVVANFFNLGVEKMMEWIAAGQLYAYHVNGTSDFVVPLLPLRRRMKRVGLSIPVEVQELYSGRILVVSDNEQHEHKLRTNTDQDRIQVMRVSPSAEPDVRFKPDCVFLDLKANLSSLQGWVSALRDTEVSKIPYFMAFSEDTSSDGLRLDGVAVYACGGSEYIFSDEHCYTLSNDLFRRKYHSSRRENQLGSIEWRMTEDLPPKIIVPSVFTTNNFQAWNNETRDWVLHDIMQGTTFAHHVMGTSDYLIPPDPLRQRLKEFGNFDFTEELERAHTGDILVVSGERDLLGSFKDAQDSDLYRVRRVGPEDNAVWHMYVDCVVLDMSIGEEKARQWIDRLTAGESSYPPALVAVGLSPESDLIPFFHSTLPQDKAFKWLASYATNGAMKTRYAL